MALGGGNGGTVGVWGRAGMWGALGTGGKWHLQPSLPPPPFVSPFLGAHEGDNGGTSAAGTVGWHGVVAVGGTMSSPPHDMSSPPSPPGRVLQGPPALLPPGLHLRHRHAELREAVTPRGCEPPTPIKGL